MSFDSGYSFDSHDGLQSRDHGRFPPLNDKRCIKIVIIRPSLPHILSYRSRHDPAEHFRLNRYKVEDVSLRKTTGQVHAVGLAARLWSGTWVQAKHSRKQSYARSGASLLGALVDPVVQTSTVAR